MSRTPTSRNSLLSGEAVGSGASLALASGLRPATGAPPLRESLLLRPTEAAHQLGIGRSKLFEMLARDELPVIRLGRCVRIPRRELEIWVNHNLEAETADRNAYLGLGQRGRWGPCQVDEQSGFGRIHVMLEPGCKLGVS